MKIRTNPKHLSAYKTYLSVWNAVESYLRHQGYLKIDLPVLSPVLIPESYLEVFETVLRRGRVQEKMYLTPSPELFLKRLVAQGIGNCFYLGKAFRNSDPYATLHSPEFTMLELYKVHAHYMDIAEEVLKLLQYIASHDKDKPKDSVTYNQVVVSLKRWEKISVAQAFARYADIGKDELLDHNRFINKAKKKGYGIEKSSYEDLWSQIYVQEIEPHLGMNGYPTLIYDYPKEFAALAKLNDDGKTAQRFEFYIAGIEIGDCYTELTNAKEQEQRFIEETDKRRKTGKIEHPIDKGFIETLQYGLVPCAGIAIGFERLAMIFAQASSIRELRLITID